MKKLLTGILIVGGLVFLLVGSFIFYGQVVLDYSLESLAQALATTQEESPAEPGGRVFGLALQSLTLEEITREDADLERVVLLETAARAIRDAVEQSGYARAGVYLAEILKDRAPQRGLFLQSLDALYHFVRRLLQSLGDLLSYGGKRVGWVKEPEPLESAGILLLGEAERKEKEWKLEEAERYYLEFLDRFSGRPERGFVSIALAHVLMKMSRFEEAENLLREVRNSFAGAREEALAANLLNQIGAIQKRLGTIPELEAWIEAEPERLFLEEGGLKLAMSYLATYQTDQALSLFERLEEAEDPRIRTKALFYQAWIHKWRGELDKSKELFEILGAEPDLEERLAFAATAGRAEVLERRGEYEAAMDAYEILSRKAVKQVWQALTDLEQGNIALFALGDAKAAQDLFGRLNQILPLDDPQFELLRKRLEELKWLGMREDAFRALAEGRIEVASKMFEEYLEKFPRDGTAHSALASISLLRGLLNEALERAETGYGYERTEYTASVLGYVYEKLERFEESAQYYKIGIDLKPTYLPARFNLAWIAIGLGRFEEADAVLRELEAERKGYSELLQAKILNNRGVALWGLGKKKEALSHFKEAIKVRPDLAEAQKNLRLAKGEKPVLAVI